MVTLENFEEYLMMAADGELGEAEGAALGAFLAAHPELQDELIVWETVKLVPEPAMVYEEKDVLLKKEPKVISLGWKVYSFAAAAAILLALVFVPKLWQRQQAELVGKREVKPAATERVGRTDTTAVRLALAAAQNRAHRPASFERKLFKKHLQQATQVRTQERPVLALHPVNETRLAIVAQKPQPQALPQPEPMKIAIATAPELPESGTMPHIHFALANQPAVALLKDGLEQRVAQVASAAQTIRNTELTVRIGHTSIKLN